MNLKPRGMIAISPQKRADKLETNDHQKEHYSHYFPTAAGREPMLDPDKNCPSKQYVEHRKKCDGQRCPQGEPYVGRGDSDQNAQRPTQSQGCRDVQCPIEQPHQEISPVTERKTQQA